MTQVATCPAPSAAFQPAASRAPPAPPHILPNAPGALIPPPDETTQDCIEAALAHAERGMAALRIALSINCPRHLRISYEKFAAAAKAIEAAMLADRLQAMCDEPAADDPNAEPPADDRNSDPLYGERMDSADCGEN